MLNRIITIENEREAAGRWLAEVLEIVAALTYGPTRYIADAKALVLRVMAKCLERGESVSDLVKAA